MGAELRRPLYSGVDVAIGIVATDDGRPVFQRDASRSCIPASAIKVLLSGVSLIHLGARTRFSTPLGTDGVLLDDVLNGSLYLVGQGDSSLTEVDLDRAAAEIRGQGILRITGDLVYDVSLFDHEEPRYPPNARHLYAPPGALTVNYNWIRTKLDDGPPPRLELIPPTSYARLDYDIRLSTSEEPGRPTMTYRQRPWGDEFMVEGTVTRWDRRFDYLRLSVSRPGLYAATLMREALARHGVKVAGEVRDGKAPDDASVLVRIRGLPLIEALRAVNAESNNVVAETVNKQLGARFVDPPGTRDKGLKVLRRFLIGEIGFEPGSFTIADASGLSSDNRVSALQFTRALRYFFDRMGNSFVETLARQGHHPHARYPVPPASMKVYVKSGTLPATGVNTAVGYVQLEKSGRTYVFAILTRRSSKGPPVYSGTFTTPLLKAMLAGFHEAAE